MKIGLRSGEKLYEELLIDKEHQIKTSNEKIYIEEKEHRTLISRLQLENRLSIIKI